MLSSLYLAYYLHDHYISDQTTNNYELSPIKQNHFEEGNGLGGYGAKFEF